MHKKTLTTMFHLNQHKSATKLMEYYNEQILNVSFIYRLLTRTISIRTFQQSLFIDTVIIIVVVVVVVVVSAAVVSVLQMCERSFGSKLFVLFMETDRITLFTSRTCQNISHRICVYKLSLFSPMKLFCKSFCITRTKFAYYAVLNLK